MGLRCFVLGHAGEFLKSSDVHPLQTTGWGFTLFSKCTRCHETLVERRFQYPSFDEATDMMDAYTKLLTAIKPAFQR